MIVYLSWLPTGGFTLSQHVIFIKTKYKNDYGLLAHERRHQVQMRRVGTLWFAWRYLTHQPFRLQAEIEAYRVQIGCGADVDKMAALLAMGYRIGLSQSAAREMLVTGDSTSVNK